MDQAAEQHLAAVQTEFITLLQSKYRKGQEEHGGTLSDKPAEYLLDCAIDEAVDQVVYLLSLRNKLRQPVHYTGAPTKEKEK